METASKFLLSLINDILDMSKIESGKMELSSKAFSMDDLLQNTRNIMEIAVTTMTGDQIVKILQSSFEDAPELQSTFTCFVTSGLKVEYALWAGTGEHLVTVTNADGSEFDLDKTYSVSYCNGSFTMQGSSSTEVTNSIIPGLEPEKIYQESIVELLGPVVKKDKEIAPFTDGSLVLNWDIVGQTK